MEEPRNHVDDERRPSTETGQNKRSKIYILIIVGLIVGLILMYLIIRPKGADAQPMNAPAHGAVIITANSAQG